ncbi:hypothetical protein BJ322DRAFT_1025673 [Thelephora terrestris]|uniref:F-box domain-containing protein n=1 Tax=Thelephora terrestris TaxID=56493 RepID=A0A9P6H1M9_9AGAM|nr:hypothetical protein BJ322DRAFT_1025673 [Thelephora terrestris]
MGRQNKQRQIRKGWELPRGVAPIAEAPVDRVRKGSRNAATDRRPVIGCSQDVPMQEYRGGAGFDSGVISPIRSAGGDTIELKRAHNSLLNISIRIPPEILGHVFYWTVLERRILPRLRGGSLHVLLVCHYWQEVASQTPRLWSFWGHLLVHWYQRFKLSRSVPADLVLNGYIVGERSPPVREALRLALREHAQTDIINSVQLWNERRPILEQVLAALTPDEGEVRTSSIRIINLRLVNASRFMARLRFPQLTYLCLSTGTQVVDLRHLGEHTGALSTLVLTLENHGASALPTVSELLLLFLYNPRLEDVTLHRLLSRIIPPGFPIIRVPLRNLKRLTIDGEAQSIFQLMKHLAYPADLEAISLMVADYGPSSICDTLGKVALDYFQLQSGRRVEVGIDVRTLCKSISVQADSILEGADGNAMGTSARFIVYVPLFTGRRQYVQLCLDLVGCVPPLEVTAFRGELSARIVQRVIKTMPNILDLHLVHAELEPGFLRHIPTTPNVRLLPSLRQLCLEESSTHEGSWQPLVELLAELSADGNDISLTMLEPQEHICRHVLRNIELLVAAFDVDGSVDADCPFDWCGVTEEG